MYTLRGKIDTTESRNIFTDECTLLLLLTKECKKWAGCSITHISNIPTICLWSSGWQMKVSTQLNSNRALAAAAKLFECHKTASAILALKSKSHMTQNMARFVPTKFHHWVYHPRSSQRMRRLWRWCWHFCIRWESKVDLISLICPWQHYLEPRRIIWHTTSGIH